MSVPGKVAKVAGPSLSQLTSVQSHKHRRDCAATP